MSARCLALGLALACCVAATGVAAAETYPTRPILLVVPFLFVGDLATLLVLTALLGPAYGGITVVLDLLYAQVVDADFVKTRRMRGGIFSGVMGPVLRLSPALAGMLVGALLARSGYDPRLAELLPIRK